MLGWVGLAVGSHCGVFVDAVGKGVFGVEGFGELEDCGVTDLLP